MMTNRAQEQGMVDYRQGRAYFENPYPDGAKKHAWGVGWSLAWSCDPKREERTVEDGRQEEVSARCARIPELADIAAEGPEI